MQGMDLSAIPRELLDLPTLARLQTLCRGLRAWAGEEAARRRPTRGADLLAFLGSVPVRNLSAVVFEHMSTRDVWLCLQELARRIAPDTRYIYAPYPSDQVFYIDITTNAQADAPIVGLQSRTSLCLQPIMLYCPHVQMLSTTAKGALEAVDTSLRSLANAAHPEGWRPTAWFAYGIQMCKLDLGRRRAFRSPNCWFLNTTHAYLHGFFRRSAPARTARAVLYALV